jgi:hypothetical protein
MKYYVILLITLLLCSCTIRMSNLYVDDSFSFSNLKEGKLIVGGIYSKNGNWNSKQLAEYSNVVRNTLSRKRHELTIVGAEKIIENLGESEFNSIAQMFSDGKRLEKNSLIKLGLASNGFKYILFAIILRDDIQHKQSKETEEKNGNKSHYNVYETNRKTLFYSEIYDLTLVMLVWSGEIEKKYTTTNRTPHDHSKGILKYIFNELFEDAVFGQYPQPASTEKMIKRAFRVVAENLTK